MGRRGWKEEVAWEGVGRNKREPGREWAGKREGLLEGGKKREPGRE